MRGLSCTQGGSWACASVGANLSAMLGGISMKRLAALFLLMVRQAVRADQNASAPQLVQVFGFDKSCATWLEGARTRGWRDEDGNGPGPDTRGVAA